MPGDADLTVRRDFAGFAGGGGGVGRGRCGGRERPTEWCRRLTSTLLGRADVDLHRRMEEELHIGDLPRDGHEEL